MGYLEITKEDMKMQKTLLNLYYQAIADLPEGRLHCKMMDRQIRYFKWDKAHKKQEYIRKKDEDLVYDLKYRRMLEEAIKTMEQNLAVQEKVLKKYKAYDPASLQGRLGKVYQDMPETLYFPDAKGKRNKTNYQLDYRKEELIHKSSFGMKFRSKSEALIAELVHVAKIPFLYETRLVLHDEWGEKHYYYPDFTFEPPNGEKFFWDHLGRMDLKEYRDKNFKRLSVFHYNNIFPPNNLILTMEDKKGGIDVSGINRIITGQLMPLFAEE